MPGGIKKFVHALLPDKIDSWLTEYYFVIQQKQNFKLHKKAINSIRKKGKAKVAFFIFKESVWKFEELYRLMLSDKNFDPVLVVCPYIDYGEKTMFADMDKAFHHFQKNNYRVVKTYNKETRKWLDVKKELKPDIIFFSAPWYITKPQYLIENFKEFVTCYVPYTFVISNKYEGYFNQHMQNFVWRSFQETKIHKEISLKIARNKGVNTVVTGYPGMDRLLSKNFKPKNVWKDNGQNLKRVIWSPHHTITGLGNKLDYSTFLKYFDSMIEIAKSFQNKIQFSFKPHPSLRSKLELPEIWGKDQTEKYFEKWAKLPNGQVNEGDYIDLFATSDGIINDSSAFVIEYLYAEKPQLFLVNDSGIMNRFNEVGQKALSVHYHGFTDEDIKTFLEKVILHGEDPMKKMRSEFFNSVVKPPNNLTASENIYNLLKTEILSH